MEDHQIVALYFRREAEAVEQTAARYGAYCRAIARNILSSDEDAEECVNDALLRAWDSIPPHRPPQLAPYLGKLTRNLAFDRWRAQRAAKRGGGAVALALEELGECVPAGGTVEQAAEAEALREALDEFLATLAPRQRRMFVRRYWYADPVDELAARFGMTQGSVSVQLSRTRKKLRIFLQERGFFA